MRERPDPKRLLGEAQRTLLEELLPGLDEDQRFQARMIASVLGIVTRQAEAGDGAWEDLRDVLAALCEQPEADLESLLSATAKAVREGRWDADDRLYTALRSHIRARLAVANPKALPDP